MAVVTELASRRLEGLPRSNAAGELKKAELADLQAAAESDAHEQLRALEIIPSQEKNNIEAIRKELQQQAVIFHQEPATHAKSEFVLYQAGPQKLTTGDRFKNWVIRDGQRL